MDYKLAVLPHIISGSTVELSFAITLSEKY